MATFGTAVFGAATFGGSEPTPTVPPVGAERPPNRLEHPMLGVLTLSDDRGYIVSDLDLGFPEVRAVSSPRINANGEDDRTALTGARVVTFTVKCFAPGDGSASLRQVLQRLRAYANPALRPVLVFAEDDGALQRVVLRGEPPSWPMAFGQPQVGRGQMVQVQMSFTAPSGLLESYAESTAEVPAVPAAGPGRTYPLRYPRRYPVGSVAGAVTVTNGDEFGADTDFVARLYGPCVGPRLQNVTTGATLSLPGLSLAEDQFAEVDIRESTIRLNGRATESLYGSQEWGVSTFWQLAGGANEVRYAPTSYESTARAVLTFRPATL